MIFQMNPILNTNFGCCKNYICLKHIKICFGVNDMGKKMPTLRFWKSLCTSLRKLILVSLKEGLLMVHVQIAMGHEEHC